MSVPAERVPATVVSGGVVYLGGREESDELATERADTKKRLDASLTYDLVLWPDNTDDWPEEPM
jgi:hypothetical protein